MKSEEEMQEIRNAVVQACDEVLENYDWDKAFQKYLNGIEPL
jgi:uncharacterized protein YajQ (UPF0234 family)